MGVANLIHPSTPDHVRIALGEAASEALRAAGDAFLIIGRGTHDHAPGRMVIHCVPIDKKTADLACGVILGTHKASRIKAKS